MLQTAAPQFSVADAAALARDQFDIEATPRLLTAERDQNFHLLSRSGAEFVLKIANAAEAPEAITFQNAVMRHLEAADPHLPTPHVVPARSGACHIVARGHIVRVLSWRAGRLMHQVERTRSLRQSLGKVHARLAKAMHSCAASAPPSDLLWDLQRASQLRPLLNHISDAERARVLAAALDRFEAAALPWLEKAPNQIIHNDLNPHNVVVGDDGAVSGIIDFGDMVRAPLICDVAVAAAYHVRHDNDPLADASEYIEAFSGELPLDRDALSLLPDLVAMRLAMTVLITNWRAQLYPGNRAYILRNEPNAWRGLVALRSG